MSDRILKNGRAAKDRAVSVSTIPAQNHGGRTDAETAMPIRNRLLNMLAPDDLAAITPALEPVDLPQGLVLSQPHDIDHYCYFPLSGVGSTVIVSPAGNQSEVGLFGREGMSPASALLDSDRNPCRVIMQVAGTGLRVETSRLVGLMDSWPPLRRLLLRWAYVVNMQMAFTAQSNAIHSIDKRLARWILMCHDRLDEDELSLTHEFLSIMLSVRRSSVTASLHVLEGERLIYAERKAIRIRDRAGLEAFADDAYGSVEREYQRLLGPMGDPPPEV